MPTVAEVQAAVERLPVDERIVLFRWLEESDAIRAETKRSLLADLDAGLAEADRGDLIEGGVVIERLKARARGAA